LLPEKILTDVRFLVVSDPQQTETLSALIREILASYEDGVDPKNYDAYDSYLLGMISRRLSNIDGATDYLVAAIKSNCFIWGAWVELAFLIMDRKKVIGINCSTRCLKDTNYLNFYFNIFTVKSTGKNASRLFAQTFFSWPYIS